MTPKTALDKIRFPIATRVKTFLGERYAASARLHKVVFTLQRIIKTQDGNKDKTADMLPKVIKLYEQTRAREVVFRSAKVSELWEKINKLTTEGEVEDLELQTMQGLVEEATKT